MIYFIRNPVDSLVKIGFTNNLGNRLRKLKAIHGKELFVAFTLEGDRRLEKLIHSQYKKNRVSGEWFVWDDAIKKEWEGVEPPSFPPVEHYYLSTKLPGDLYFLLKERAKKEHRSMVSQAIHVLQIFFGLKKEEDNGTK